MPLTQQEILSRDFTFRKNGYDNEQVDRFLEQVATSYQELLDEVQRHRRSGDKPYEALGEEVGRVLQTAKDVADELRKKAQDEAVSIRADAQQEAARVEGQARATLDRAKEEAAALTKKTQEEADALTRKTQDETTALTEKTQTEAQDLTTKTKQDADALIARTQAEAASTREAANKDADQIRAEARQEAARRIKEAADQVKKLRAAEMSLSQKLTEAADTLTAVKGALDATHASAPAPPGDGSTDQAKKGDEKEAALQGGVWLKKES
jgi:DivIVA domain-containing protein